MPIHVPVGLFWFEGEAFSREEIKSLSLVAEKLYKPIWLVSSYDLKNVGTTTTVLSEIPQDGFDYIFLSPNIADKYLNNLPLLEESVWACEMLPIDADFQEAFTICHERLNDYPALSACGIRNIAAQIGSSSDIIFTSDFRTYLIYADLTATALWQTIFRASGKFTVKADIVGQEITYE